jgi:uncharacterized membrane protein
MALGPVQVLVVGFEEGKFRGEVLEELKRLREADIVRVVDLLFVTKDEAGDVAAIEMSGLNQEESMEFGAFIGALFGLGYEGEEGMEIGAEVGALATADGVSVLEDDMWYLADAIPAGTSAGVVLLEHQWAIPLRDAIQRAGGVALADSWIHPVDLVAIGMEAALEAGE